MRAIEEECKEWGFEEAVLVVEKNNREATSLYKKLGYRGIGGEPDTPNLVVNADGKVVEGRVRTALMRKSLRRAPPAPSKTSTRWRSWAWGRPRRPRRSSSRTGGYLSDVRTPPRDDVETFVARRSSTDDAITITPSLNTLSS